MMMWKNKKFHIFVALAVFILATLIFAWPILPNVKGILFGRPNDAMGSIWGIWWLKYSLLNLRTNPNISYLIAYPYGIDTHVFLTPVNYILSIPVTAIFNALASYNFITLMSFPLSALAMYLLVYHFTKKIIPSIIAGLIIAFGPFHVVHSQSFIDLAQIEWPIFCVLFLFKLNEERTYKNLIGLSIFFILTVLTTPYYAIFLLMAVLVFAITKIFYKTPVEKRSRGFGVVFIIYLLVFCATLIYIYPKFIKNPAHIPPRTDLTAGGAKIEYYLLPSTHHPIFGQDVKKVVPEFSYTLQTIFLGYVPLLLALFLFFKKEKFKNQPNLYFAIHFFTFAAIIAFLFSLMPTVKIFGKEIKTFSYYFYDLVPFIRAQARQVLIIMIALAAMSGIAVNYLLDYVFQSKQSKIIFIALILFISLIEFLPEQVTTDLRKIPDVYVWLKQQPGQFAVLEYPFFPFNSDHNYEEMFYQTYHQKPLVNSFKNSVKERKNYEDFERVLETINPDILYDQGVRYVLMHTQDDDPARQKIISDSLKPSDVYDRQMEEVKIFPDATVFKITHKR